MNVPSVYLDTNVLIDAFNAKRKLHKEAVLLLELIKEKRWVARTSIFTLIEFTEAQKSNYFAIKKIQEGTEIREIAGLLRNMELSSEEIAELGKRKADFLKGLEIVLVELNADGWSRALELSSNYNVSGPDAIHLSAALQVGCKIIATNDTDFIKEGNAVLDEEREHTALVMCQPKDVAKIMDNKG